MPFYGQRGDFYGGRGDFYRGDPFWGAIARGALAVGRAVVGGTARRAASRTVQTAAAAGATGYAMGQGRGMIPRGAMQGGGKTTAVARIVSRCSGLNPGSDAWYEAGCKTRRKMNALNPKALRRALRRAEGFEKFAARTVNALYRVIDGRKVRTFKKKSA